MLLECILVAGSFKMPCSHHAAALTLLVRPRTHFNFASYRAPAFQSEKILGLTLVKILNRLTTIPEIRYIF